ncbi:hypothetical protein B0H21DRAFT_283865 [Amylocystis lapponica]|nr:hypothetical protein B0H21DRAFT_283865 [Amylocystis lapponica]
MQSTDKRDALADTLEERLAEGELRKEIRIHILSGQVDEAIALLNRHFPRVLSEPEEVPTGRPVDRQGYIPATSIDPTHLALNLRILAFIEAARTIPLPYYPPGTKVPPSPVVPSASKDIDMLRHESSSDDANDQLLHRAQNLYSDANRLPDPNDRAKYLHELAQVGGLLAYTVPERGPMAVYMTQERREAVADMVESAILYRTGRRTLSAIEHQTRYTSVVWSILHDLNEKPPPRSAWPAGASLPPSGKTKARSGASGETVPHVTAKKSSRDKDAAEPVPRSNCRPSWTRLHRLRPV